MRNDDFLIGQYFSPLHKSSEYLLLCIYLNRIYRLSNNEIYRRYLIASIFIHEVMHSLFDTDTRHKTHLYDSNLEEPTCECGAIIIAKEVERVHPEFAGFGNWTLNTVDNKQNKYGLGANLYGYWNNWEYGGSNAVDDYKNACNYIHDKVNWTGRHNSLDAIREMKTIYHNALLGGISNQGDKSE